ncbi:MAG: hypothetical protein R6U41_09035 [Desulfosalsimonas sp.]|uniref:hypothetical protein n=1 Tax=Desulfosalsimonas sp. TaxID=3073848 RepID=UPI0039711152
MVVLTSNNYRDMSDALKRRCIHLYIDYPEPELEKRIIRLKLPGIDEALADRLVCAVNHIRELDMKKRPCISETLDWAQALMVLNIDELSCQWLNPEPEAFWGTGDSEMHTYKAHCHEVRTCQNLNQLIDFIEELVL